MSVSSRNETVFGALRDQAQHALDKAEIDFKKADQATRFAQQQLSLLKGYYEEYQIRLSTSLLNGMPEHAVANFQLFMSTVEKSIEQQKQCLITVTVKRTQALQSVYGCKQKLKTYDTLIDKQQKRLVQQENKREQKQSDEFAQQRFIRKSVHEYRY